MNKKIGIFFREKKVSSKKKLLLYDIKVDRTRSIVDLVRGKKVEEEGNGRVEKCCNGREKKVHETILKAS